MSENGKPTVVINPPVVTLAQAAEYLGLSIQAMRQRHHRGTGPKYIQCGPKGHIRYRMEHLEEWLNKNTHDPSEG